ncbi:unnamed protein product [Linum tenue]|uniref:Uncharacterized protein n=1 Tax=Linum tenue TaxID=586396 RepID=A0AAV0P0F1_9ROSI|nr:unnamed protein product [Linum tenue]
MWEELPAEMAKLPPTKHQTRWLLRGRRQPHLQPLHQHRQQMVDNSGTTAGEDGQRHKELLEHPAEEEAAGQAAQRPPPPPPQIHQYHRCTSKPPTRPSHELPISCT